MKTNTVKIVASIFAVFAIIAFGVICLRDNVPASSQSVGVVNKTANTTKATKITKAAKATASTKSQAVTTAKKTTKKTTTKQTKAVTKKESPQTSTTVSLPTIPTVDEKTQEKLNNAVDELCRYGEKYSWEATVAMHDSLSGCVGTEIVFRLTCGGEDSYGIVIKPDEKGALRYYDGKETNITAVKKWLFDHGIHSVTNNLNAL